jgi:hypothetical protein
MVYYTRYVAFGASEFCQFWRCRLAQGKRRRQVIGGASSPLHWSVPPLATPRRSDYNASSVEARCATRSNAQALFSVGPMEWHYCHHKGGDVHQAVMKQALSKFHNLLGESGGKHEQPQE